LIKHQTGNYRLKSFQPGNYIGELSKIGNPGCFLPVSVFFTVLLIKY